MGRTRGGYRGWMDDPLVDPAEVTDEDLADDEPVIEYMRQQANKLERQLASDPPTDPVLRQRLERELDAWRRSIEAETTSEHWTSGEGDRKLF